MCHPDLLPYIKNASERFWAKVHIKGPHDCWLWTAAKTSNGYGQFWVKQKILSAHRIAHFLVFGTMPLIVGQSCLNRLCCNPEHFRDKRKSRSLGLTPEQVIEIMTSDESQQVLSEKLGVSRTTIRTQLRRARRAS